MLTPEEIITLAPYEKHLRNALSDFMCNPGRTAIKAMDEIYRRATGYPLATDASCGKCILAMMKRLAVLYFEAKVPKPKTKRNTTTLINISIEAVRNLLDKILDKLC